MFVESLKLFHMKQTVLSLDGPGDAGIVETEVSFEPFYRFIKNRSGDEIAVKKKLYDFILQRIELIPDITKPVPLADMHGYSELLELIYTSVTGITSERDELYWALSVPGRPQFFYATDSLVKLFVDCKTEDVKDYLLLSVEENLKGRYAYLYTTILQRFYGYTLPAKDLLLYFTNPESKLIQCYKININEQFIDVETKAQLPSLNFRKVEKHVQKGTHIDYLLKVMPLSMFRLKGIGIISLVDHTTEYVIEKIKTGIIETATKPKEKCVSEVQAALNTLAGCSKIKFGFIPLAKLNNKPLLDFASLSNSVLLNYGNNKIIAGDKLLALAENYIKEPVSIFIKDINRFIKSSDPLIKILRAAGVQSYALSPLIYNNQLAGVMEVYSTEPGLVNEKQLLKLDAALPYIAQLVKTTVDDFQQKIALLVNDKFTSLQPSVQWRFNEAAFNHMRNRLILRKEPELETIRFRDVYPLYGAIDIRNSSVERNNAAREDYIYCLDELASAFTALKEKHQLALMDEMIFKTKKWKTAIKENLSPTEEYKLDEFFENDALPFLNHLKKIKPVSAEIVNAFIALLDPAAGRAFENRRSFENSMQLINRTISQYFDDKKDELQQSYPCYFEKIRTDGVEYDIYIGQSIAPEHPFDVIYLRNLRLWQLQSMAEIYKAVQQLQPQLDKPLNITQLIFINGNTIDISFRNDEKRFDVDGGYNIRYQVIKKRIDKVKIKDTGERLTQPGKIAMVYYNKKEAEEYESYISFLQEQNILDDDLEYVELEQLQGVAGLKALRVSLYVD